MEDNKEVNVALLEAVQIPTKQEEATEVASYSGATKNPLAEEKEKKAKLLERLAVHESQSETIQTENSMQTKTTTHIEATTQTEITKQKETTTQTETNTQIETTTQTDNTIQTETTTQTEATQSEAMSTRPTSANLWPRPQKVNLVSARFDISML